MSICVRDLEMKSWTSGGVLTLVLTSVLRRDRKSQLW
jgi:hypothetical protein